ncbi:MAG: XylR family transcriptional regulator [bacterium]|nr:XylR family transcriptional regulator [Candidatus Colisoma equi]
MKPKKRIRVGVSIEHIREWGRQICRGVSAFAQVHPDWSLTLFEKGLPGPDELRRCDGFLWCVNEARTARRLAETGRPVVNLISGRRFGGMVSVAGDDDAIGRLAARFLMERRFGNFAFCGWGGLYFSDARGAAFEDELKRSGFKCVRYRSRGRNARRDVEYSAGDDKLFLPGDAKEIEQWVRELPKPIAIFCASDYRAWHLSEICSRIGIDVPKSVALLGVDNDPIPSTMTAPTISSIDKDTFRTGYLAAETLDRIIRGERSRTDLTPILVQPLSIVSRESTAIYPVEPQWLADAMLFIHDGVADALTAADVAKHVNLSYSNVEATFRRVLKTTVQKQIMAARLARAEELLLMTDLSLAEISEQSGFRSQQYFTNAFRSVHHASPTAWKGKRIL